MATIAEQLTSLANTKTAIKDAIVAKGVAVADTDPFSAYAGKIGQISGGGGEETRFGVGIGDFLGTVDADGNYVEPSINEFTFDLTGVTSVPLRAFAYAMAFPARASVTGSRITIIANDVKHVAQGGFQHMFSAGESVSAQVVARFNGLEEVSAGQAFYSCFSGCFNVDATFNSLKKVYCTDGLGSSFREIQGNSTLEADKWFPVLEEIDGHSASNIFGNYCQYKTGFIYRFSSLKKIVGNPSSTYSSVFGNAYVSMVWHLPRAVNLSGYCWNINASYPGEIHFAAANQAAIEACEGYDYKWGFAGATIYFDLMLDIIVNGVTYTRLRTIDGYTSWKDTDGNLVYTDATAEPAVGTVVYSDQGTTQVGTVEGVA